MSLYSKELSRNFNLSMASIYDNQIYKPDEIVLVIDGRITDELEDSIQKWCVKLKNKLNVVRLHENKGLGYALNRGVKACRSTFIARMDTDDISDPYRFKIQMDFLRVNPDIDIVGSFAQEIDYNDKYLSVRMVPLSHDIIYKNLYLCPIIHPSVLFRKKSIDSIGSYNSSLSRRQDYEMWFRAAKAGLRFANIPQSLILYRFTEKTHKRQTMKLMLQQAVIGYNGVLSINQPYWKAVFCFIPFFRSFLPAKFQHIVYRIMKRVDPRNMKKNKTC
jgi:glycosyltransferase involved in cell wall biosynthesis